MKSLRDEEHERIDDALVLFFAAPHSYTGEDLVEFHLHGSPAIVREVLRAAMAAGSRMANAGEFTQRAFLNGKLDLHAASAVADIIDAESRSAARAALANLGGTLVGEVRALRERLSRVLEELAASIDYPDEVAEPERGAVAREITAVGVTLAAMQRDGERGRLLREGVSVAIIGPPNAGKSSLLNALLGEERAIVSEIPGTTRDTIEERVLIDGVPLRIIDTAGIRDHADRIEAIGIERARRASEQAEVLLVVLDGSEPLSDSGQSILAATAHRPRVVFANKADRGNVLELALDDCVAVVGSVRDATTLEALRRAIARVAWGGERIDVARPHISAAHEFSAMAQARRNVDEVEAVLQSGEPLDMLAPALHRAVAALGKISGDDAVEELLDGVFARFCIGK